MNPGNPEIGVLRVLNGQSLIALSLGIMSFGFIQRLALPRLKQSGDTMLWTAIRIGVALLLLVASLVMMMCGSYSPSIYGQF